MDIFCEYIVKKKFEALDVLKLFGIVIAAIALSFIALIIGLSFDLGIGFALVAIVFYLAYLLAKFIYTEFEYALTNNELDIDKILGKSRRKRVITVDFKTVEICASINDEKYKSEFNNTGAIAKTINVTGKSDYDIYFVDFPAEAGKTRLLFQPTDKMKDALKLINPRAIHIL